VKNPVGKIFSKSDQDSTYCVYEATVPIKDGDGYTHRPVDVELVIDHKVLRRLIEKAFRNKSKRSSDGPLTVRITG
jgi:hypothetical protein